MPPCSTGSNQTGTEQKLFVQFLAGEELMEKFEEARALLSHRCGTGSFADVLEVVLAEFVERHSPEARLKRRAARRAAAVGQRKVGVASRRRPARPNHSRRREWQNNNLRQQKAGACGPRPDQARPARHIPAAVRDAVFVRDGGACTFAARDGTRCGSKQPLQIDHVRPFAAGIRNAGRRARVEAKTLTGFLFAHALHMPLERDPVPSYRYTEPDSDPDRRA